MSTAIQANWDQIYSPFLWRNNLHNACLHSVLVNLFDEGLEVSELVHCLEQYPCQSNSQL